MVRFIYNLEMLLVFNKVCIPFCIMFLTSFCYADDNVKISLNASKTSLNITSESFSYLKIESSLSSIETSEVITPKGTFIQLQINGYSANNNYGKPNLPVLNRLIEIPCNAIADIRIVSYEEEIIDLADHGIECKILPSQPSISKDPDPAEREFYYNKEFYINDMFSDLPLAKVEHKGIIRGVGFGILSIFPFSYNPVKNILKVYNNIVIEIEFKNADILKTDSLKKKYYSRFFEPVYNRFINYQPPQNRDEITKYPVKYVIVADPVFESELSEFIQWKTKKGFAVIEAYTDNPDVGSTTTSIHDYLEELYLSGTTEDPAPTFVLFVGDVEQIPAFYGTTGEHVTDLYYCTFDGADDIVPEMYYGRFSAQNITQLTPQTDRTIEYEQYTMPDPSFLETAVLVSGVDSLMAPTHGNLHVWYGSNYYFNTDHGFVTYTYYYPESEDSTAEIISHISSGAGYANYFAHCGSGGWSNPAFTTSDIPGLNNDHKFPLIVSSCCYSNKFDDNECFGESLLRTPGKGAIGHIGASDYTYWNDDYYFGVGATSSISTIFTYEETGLGFMDCLFHDHGEDTTEWFITNSEIIFAGNLAVTEAWGNEKHCWEVFHLMGDPSLMTYLSVPETLNVNYSDEVPLGINNLTVNTEDHSYIALSLNGNLLDAKYSGSGASVDLDLTGISVPCTADIVITKQNRQPYIGSVNIISGDTPFIIYSSHSIDDSDGNGNSQADYSEDILLNMVMENVGGLDADNVMVNLNTYDTNISVTDNSGSWGSITSGNTATVNGAFAFTVNDQIEDQHNVLFELDASDGSDNWISSFYITLNAPVLALDGFLIDDSGNNIPDAGETTDIIIYAENDGHAASDDATCILSSISPYITINTGTSDPGILGIGDSIPCVFNITIDDLTPPGTIVDLIFTLIAGDYSLVRTVNIPVGIVTEDWEIGNFGMFDWDFEGDIPWVICDSIVYEGLYSSMSGDITDNQTTSLYIMLNVIANDSISFYKKVSCEEDPTLDEYDFLVFEIDGIEQDRWDGQIDWSYESYFVTQGEHTFKWTYSKDYSISDYDDCAWIDYIRLPASDFEVIIEQNNLYSHITDLNIYPNPVGDNGNISFYITQKGIIRLSLYNISGREEKVLINNKTIDKGNYKVSFNTSSLDKGFYICRLLINNYDIKCRKFIVVR